MKFDVIVIGAGAAGLMCALEAGKRGRSVVVLEHQERIGKKILISGGGRCNFTNLEAGPENYLSSNPHFCKSALARYSPQDFLALVESHQIAWHEKKLGQLFCDRSSREIVEMLEYDCQAAGVKIHLNCVVEEIRKPSGFELRTNQGLFTSESVVIATGGLSFPKMGATDFGYRMAEQFGLKCTVTRPGLVPLSFAPDEQSFWTGLTGVSLDATVSTGGMSFRENILFTHQGLSGPAILQISNHFENGIPLVLNLFPERPIAEILQSTHAQTRELVTVLSEHLPRRFAQSWCDRFVPSQPMNRYTIPQLEAIARQLEHWELQPTGTAGYAKAEVTVGGVDTTQLSSKTMESVRVPGLFFCGEVVDVTGWLGGFNFQWAWASGYAAGQAV